MYTGINYTNIGTRMRANSNFAKILVHVFENNGATKYECLVLALKMRGTKQELRGAGSTAFDRLKNGGLLSYDSETYEYSITEKGEKLLMIALDKD